MNEVRRERREKRERREARVKARLSRESPRCDMLNPSDCCRQAANSQIRYTDQDKMRRAKQTQLPSVRVKTSRTHTRTKKKQMMNCPQVKEKHACCRAAVLPSSEATH